MFICNPIDRMAVGPGEAFGRIAGVASNPELEGASGRTVVVAASFLVVASAEEPCLVAASYRAVACLAVASCRVVASCRAVTSAAVASYRVASCLVASFLVACQASYHLVAYRLGASSTAARLRQRLLGHQRHL